MSLVLIRSEQLHLIEVCSRRNWSA